MPDKPFFIEDTKTRLPAALLFLPYELQLLFHANLGLRLTNRVNEADKGGHGDAVPLSHLAGAKEIVEFVWLALRQDDSCTWLPGTKERMEVLYRIFDGENKSCMPILIQYHASRYGIKSSVKMHADSFQVPQESRPRLPNEEASKLKNYDLSCLTIDKIVVEFPTLAQYLADNFNHQLACRLNLNYWGYADSDDMDYLILTESSEKDFSFYQSGYDFSHYPMGKVGRRTFSSEQVLDQHMILAGKTRSAENEQKLLYSLINRIKARIYDGSYQPVAYPNPLIDRSSFWYRHRLALLLSLAGGLIAGVGLGLGMGVFGAIPTGAATILATPFAVLILGVVGTIVGLAIGIIACLISDYAHSRTSPASPLPLPFIENKKMDINKSGFFHSEKNTLDNSNQDGLLLAR